MRAHFWVTQGRQQAAISRNRSSVKPIGAVKAESELERMSQVRQETITDDREAIAPALYSSAHALASISDQRIFLMLLISFAEACTSWLYHLTFPHEGWTNP